MLVPVSFTSLVVMHAYYVSSPLPFSGVIVKYATEDIKSATAGMSSYKILWESISP